MEEIINVDHTYQYEKAIGVETLHPLISVIDLSKAPKIEEHEPFDKKFRYGYFAVFLKDVKCGDLKYGRNTYDYQEGTLVFMAPGQVCGYFERWKAARNERLGAAFPSRSASGNAAEQKHERLFVLFL